jgi:rhodanese-related sulfurtransferase
MRALGVENIFGISGGMAGWSEANMPLVSKKK